MRLASKKGIDNTDKLMDYRHNSFLETFSLGFFSLEIFPEHRINFDHGCCHEIEDSSQTFITSFRDSTLAFKLSGFMDRGIDSGKGDHFFRGRELFIINFSQEMGRSDIVYSLDRFKDFHLAGGFFLGGFNKKGCDFFKFLLESDEDYDFCFKDLLVERGVEADRFFSSGDKFFWRGRIFSSSLREGEEATYLGWSGCGESLSGREVLEESEGGRSKRVDEAEELREKEVKDSFNFIFEGSDMLRDSFSFPGQGSEVYGACFRLGEIGGIDSEEFSDEEGIFSVSFCFSQGELGEVRDKEWVKEETIEVMRGEEGEEVEVVRARRFHANDEVLGVLAMVEEGLEEREEAWRGHGEGKGGEDFLVFVDQGSMKRILGDIDATKKINHGNTSFDILTNEAGYASPSILHGDKGSQTQSTYKDLGRQVTDSFEGSKTQVLCSYPASSFSSYQAYSYIFNINYL
jgi:hypothetical protein